MARVMLNSKKLSSKLQAKVVNTACYTINRVYLRPSTTKTPYEIWKAKKLNLSYFHIFGCICYILNDKEQLGKFQPKSDKSIFLGYSLNSRAYRVYNLHTQTIMESINVVIDDFNDVSNESKEDEIDILTMDKEKQLLDIEVTPGVTTFARTDAASSSGIASEVTPKDKTSYETDLEDERFDIIDPVIKDPPSRIQKNHPTGNIIGEIEEGR